MESPSCRSFEKGESGIQSRNSFQKVHQLQDVKIKDPLTHTATIENQLDIPIDDLDINHELKAKLKEDK